MRTHTIDSTVATRARSGELLYRFEADLAEMYPVGTFPEGVRFHNEFGGEVVAGPFAGGRIFGLDRFLLRRDGVGEIDAPEVIEFEGGRIALEVRGYVIPPDGMEMPPLEVVTAPGFEFPDIDFRMTGAAILRSTAPGIEWLNETIGVLEGTVNLARNRVIVEARAA